MEGSEGEHDDAILDCLRASSPVSREQAPSELTVDVRSLLALRDLDVDLALLTFDSLLDPSARSMRGAAGPRRLSFALDGTDLDVEVLHLDDGFRLVGQVMPPAVLTVEVRSPSATQIVRTDDSGSFLVRAVPSGPTALRIIGDTGALAQTQWVTL